MSAFTHLITLDGRLKGHLDRGMPEGPYYHLNEAEEKAEGGTAVANKHQFLVAALDEYLVE